MPAVPSLKTTLPPTALPEKGLCCLSLQHPRKVDGKFLGQIPSRLQVGKCREHDRAWFVC